MSTHESSDWRRGVTYTVRPHMLSPLEPGREYRIMVSARRQAPKGEEFRGYDDLHVLATRISAMRVAALAGEVETWISDQGRRSIEMEDRQLIFLFIATSVVCRGTIPGGESSSRFDEIYIDFDHGETDLNLFSYGEYVPSAEGIDYAAYVARAEAMARHHYGSEIQAVRHDCFCATHPDVAVVHLFFRI